MVNVWILITVLLVMVSVTKGRNLDGDYSIEREKRYIDENFQRRYNHLKTTYKGNPVMFNFLKYFLRNRGQREKRQVDVNLGGFDDGYVTYVNPTRSSQPIKENKREVNRNNRPFRPAMVFF